MSLLDKKDKIYVAGSNGMVGSAICKLLKKEGYTKENKKLITNSKKELDLTDFEQVKKWFVENKPDIVIIAAAKVGGILANNKYPVDFLLDNLKIQNNLIESSWKNGVKRLLFLGSSCIYPKLSNQPIKEEYLLTDSLEETNQWYAIAKIAGLKLCEAYRRQHEFDAISLMPTNLYGPKDNYNLEDGHVMAALIRKFHEAKIKNNNEVICWGSGKPLREFLFVEDFAEASIFALKKWDPNLVNSPKDNDGKSLYCLNVGSDFEISIFDLAHKIATISGFKGKIIWDESKPDGTPRKKLDNTHLKKIGWEAITDLDCGIRKTIDSFLEEYKVKQ